MEKKNETDFSFREKNDKIFELEGEKEFMLVFPSPEATVASSQTNNFSPQKMGGSVCVTCGFIFSFRCHRISFSLLCDLLNADVDYKKVLLMIVRPPI